MRIITALHRKNKGQALVEIATFGAVLIFLIGMIIRTHVGTSFSQNYKVRALKLALKESFEGFQENNKNKPNTSRSSANILFVEDRIAPDLNKYNTLDRSPFIANASATMTNLLEYPVDAFEFTQNLPIQDVYINGQHFEFTTSGFVFRNLYESLSDCPSVAEDPAENDRCRRQIREKSGSTHKFYILTVNGTEDFDAGHASGFDYLRDGTSNDRPPEPLREYMAWQWKSTDGNGSNDKIDFGTEDSPAYPSMDTSGSLREQTIYYIKSSHVGGGSGCLINNNPHLINIIKCDHLARNLDPRDEDGGNQFSGPIKAVAVLDSQLGDIDSSFDPLMTPGPQPGFTAEMQLYTNIDRNRTSYLEIKEGKLVNPVTGQAVRSVSSKDKADLVSRVFQLSNDTGRMCASKYEDGEDNPVKACGDCLGANFSVTCFDPGSRKLYIRANIIDYGKRSWFTDITKGL